ncbi:serpin family protein [Salsuginibacillus kocurii]|uniref:serpin family protein n=1 Tax=Salsuginibacillus kocurii TaxID=427078 RepID=UPI00037D1C81|nr:serpin family protein [Salsuginibacillus kocurii]
MFQRLATFGLFGCLLMAAGCDSTGESTPSSSADEFDAAANSEVEDLEIERASEDVIAGQRAFGIELLQHTYHEDENTLISPLSIQMALAMTMNGAAGDTKADMADVMHVDSEEIDAVNETMQVLISQANATEETVFALANTIWHQQGREVNEELTDTVSRHYGAEIESTNFSDEGTLDEINSWVEQQTGGMIEELLIDLDPSTVMLLVNALYFQGDWQLPFDSSQTTEQEFETASGAMADVEMMKEEDTFPLAETETFTAVEMPYGEDKAFSMLALLPHEDQDIEDMKAELVDGNWSFLDEFTMEDFQLEFPKFTTKTNKNLNEPLKALGMEVPFAESEAEFPHLVAEEGDPLYISEVEHGTKINVNEKGTEAGAATSVAMDEDEPAKAITFDRPFLLALVENELKAPLFLGTVQNPTR